VIRGTIDPLITGVVAASNQKGGLSEMAKVILPVIACASAVLVYLFYPVNVSKKETRPFANATLSQPNNVEGVYEFVSETTSVTKPKQYEQKLSSDDWGGMWHFQKGYYTRFVMKKKRGNYLAAKKRIDFGFEVYAGPYEVDDKKVVLYQKYAAHPFEIDRTVVMQYQLDNDTLTLTQILTPYLEDIRDGKVITVLRRIKP
jgi:hypothetical protein